MRKVFLVFALFTLGAVTDWAIAATALVQTASSNEKSQKKVAILLFNDVQIIDYTGPYEVFVNASSNNFSRFNVFTVAEKEGPITTVGGMTVTPKYHFGNHPQPDILVIPGGWGVYAQRKSPQVIAWIQQNAKSSQVVLSVCNGASLLAKAGLLDGLAATTTAGGIDRLKEEVPGLKPVYDKRFVDNGKVVTSAGLSAGIDAALHVVEKVLGKGWAQKIAIDMEYNWQPESKYARALLADKYVPPTWWLLPDLQSDPVSYECGEDHWESKSAVQTDLSATQLFERIHGRLTGDKKALWFRQNGGKSSELEVRSLWRATDEKGKAWKALISVERINGKKGKLMLTIKIARSDSVIAPTIN